MRWWKAMLGAGCVAPLTGCNLFHLAAHNIYNEPVQYADECNLDVRLREEARIAWREVCRQYPDRTFTREFADGFQDGYADHLQHGGPPRPPAVPPLKYRRGKYFTPEGSLRVKDYLCGAKYGAEVAAGTGYRQFLTLPAMLENPHPAQPLNITVLPPPPDPSQEPAAAEAPQLPSGPLPAPKPLTPAPEPKKVEAPKAPLPAPTVPVPAVPPPKADDKPFLPPLSQPIVPKVEPARPAKPDPVPVGPKAEVPVPKFDELPLGSPKTADPKATPAGGKGGQTGTSLPAIDLPFSDFLGTPSGPVIKPQGGTSADPGGVVPAVVPPPKSAKPDPIPVSVPLPPVVAPPLVPIPLADPTPPPAYGPPKPRPASTEPPKPRPAAEAPPR